MHERYKKCLFFYTITLIEQKKEEVSGMPKVNFIKENIVIEVEEGTKLIDCIRKAGLKIETPCNCIGVCGKCKVKAFGELYSKTDEEQKYTENHDIRLACLARVKGNATVELLKEEKSLKTINRGFSIQIEVNNSIKRVRLPLFDEKSFVPYKDTLDFKVSDINVIKELGLVERKKNKELYGITFNNELLEAKEFIDIPLGVAVDIGTTGISAYLVDMESGEVLNKVSALNPQTEFGGDVISRITYCIEEDGVDLLSKSIRKKINLMINKLVSEGYSIESVYSVIIAANTTMLHLFLGVIPDAIAQAPYRPVFLDKLDFKAIELGIEINEKGILTLLPSASAYVGADILSGIVAVDFQNRKHSSIFIDIGTNGEIVAISEGKMAAASTAAGPALEGMNISCGSRAEEGAIDSFSIDENYNITYTTIGGEKAKGVCGSGLLDIAASLIKSNVVHFTGRFNKELPESLKDRLKDKKFYITEDIYISQKDIRQIQLAKGAIASGISMLLKEINIGIEDIEEAVIAGAFGYHLNPESISIVGIIPKGFRGKINFVGNSSIEGARIALINKEKFKEMSEMKKRIRVIELSTREDFQDYFINALNF